MEELFACVRFLDDIKQNEFISTTEIKYDLHDIEHIKPNTVDDFGHQHEYQVLWCLCKSNQCYDEDNVNCVYYKAHIVCMAETLEDVQEKAHSTRFRLPKKIFSPSDPGLSARLSHQSNAQAKHSQASNANDFNDNLEIKLRNLSSKKAIEAAKQKASQDELNEYAKDNFLNARKPFKENVCTPNDGKNLKRHSNENQFASDCSIKKNRMNEADKRNNSNFLHTGQENSDEDRFGFTDDDLNDNDPLRINTPEDILEEASAGNNNALQDSSEEDSRERVARHSRRGNTIRRPPKEVRARQPVPANVSQHERAINLYITPEAVEVDPADKHKYQVIDNMIYLGDGKAVDKDFWEFLKLRGDSLFLRETAELICGKQDLVNRCIKESKTSVILADRGDRKAIPPKKYFLIRELFQDYMTEREYDKKTKGKLLANFNKQIGSKIQDLRKALYQ